MTDKMYIPGTVVSVDSSKRGNYDGLMLTYVTDKSGHECKDFVFNSNKKLIEVLKTLEKGDKVKVQKEKKGKYTNMVAVYKNDGSTTTSSPTRHTGNTDFNTRAARGQALNLAVTVAVAEGKHEDDNYILSQIDRFLKLGEKVQKGNKTEPQTKPVSQNTTVDDGDFFA